ncbi:hypothetical protein XENTR_v10019041 [Xenopus tropicalis]|nr:hypothetical protein XENTR_v10019041 [Xenopus tropicalis]
MTVRFLRDIPPVPAQNPADRYKEGYRACVERLSAILNKSHVLTGEASNRLLNHLQRSPELCCSDCHHPPKSHSPRIVLHVSPRTSQLESPLLNQPSSHRPAPCPPQLNSSIWRPW